MKRKIIFFVAGLFGYSSIINLRNNKIHKTSCRVAYSCSNYKLITNKEALELIASGNNFKFCKLCNSK